MKEIKMIDVTGPEIVEIKISEDGRVWVNINGICALRICRIKNIEVDIPNDLVKHGTVTPYDQQIN